METRRFSIAALAVFDTNVDAVGLGVILSRIRGCLRLSQRPVSKKLARRFCIGDDLDGQGMTPATSLFSFWCDSMRIQVLALIGLFAVSIASNSWSLGNPPANHSSDPFAGDRKTESDWKTASDWKATSSPRISPRLSCEPKRNRGENPGSVAR
jgi:hypothetical protein